MKFINKTEVEPEELDRIKVGDAFKDINSDDIYIVTYFRKSCIDFYMLTNLTCNCSLWEPTNNINMIFGSGSIRDYFVRVTLQEPITYTID